MPWRQSSVCLHAVNDGSSGRLGLRLLRVVVTRWSGQTHVDLEPRTVAGQPSTTERPYWAPYGSR